MERYVNASKADWRLGSMMAVAFQSNENIFYHDVANLASVGCPGTSVVYQSPQFHCRLRLSPALVPHVFLRSGDDFGFVSIWSFCFPHYVILALRPSPQNVLTLRTSWLQWRPSQFRVVTLWVLMLKPAALLLCYIAVATPFSVSNYKELIPASRMIDSSTLCFSTRKTLSCTDVSASSTTGILTALIEDESSEGHRVRGMSIPSGTLMCLSYVIKTTQIICFSCSALLATCTNLLEAFLWWFANRIVLTSELILCARPRLCNRKVKMRWEIFVKFISSGPSAGISLTPIHITT